MALASFLSAQQLKAVVKEMTGKVEIKPAEGAWRAAKAGVTIAQGYWISTGFDPRPSWRSVSRFSASGRSPGCGSRNWSRKRGTVSTGLYLSVGKVKAEVKTATGRATEVHAQGTRVDRCCSRH